MLNWVMKRLGYEELRDRLDELEGRVDDIDSRVEALEGEVERGLRHFGGYDYRTKEELELMEKTVSDLLESVDALISHQENKEGIERARRLKSRIKNHLTRIRRNLAA